MFLGNHYFHAFIYEVLEKNFSRVVIMLVFACKKTAFATTSIFCRHFDFKEFALAAETFLN